MRKNILIISFAVFIFFSFSVFLVFAETEKQVRNQINNINEQIEELDREIAKYQTEINKTGLEKESLSKVIKELTLTRDKLLKERIQIEKKISATSLVIEEITGTIIDKEESINIAEKSLSEMINALYKKDKNTLLEIMLTKNGLWEASREYYNILEINENIKEYKEDLINKKEDLTSSKIEKLNEQDKLKTLKQTLTAKESAILNTKKEKDSLLIQTKNKEAEYQKILADRIKKRDAFEKDLASYEDQLKFILNPKLLPKPGSEVLAWPLDNVFITQLFGYTSSSKRLYKSGTHSGVDFRAAVGTPVKSVASGTVMGTGDTDIYCKGASFGKWVFIKHNNGLSTTYGHLSAISVKKGQKVNTGDIIGLSGNTGHTTGPHLHITVYASDGVKVDEVPSLSCSGKTFIMPIAASTSYLDPMLYLPKVTKDMVKK